MKRIMSEYIRTVLEIDDQDTIDEFIKDYMTLLTDSLPQMQAAWEKNDYAELRSLAHALKGCSANIGAEPVRTTSFQLQLAAEAKDSVKCNSLITHLKAFLIGMGE